MEKIYKKSLSFIMITIIIFSFSACGPRVVSDNTSNTSTVSPEEKIDVDLTKLSSTMVYSEVFNIVSAPDDYIGKKLKMKGMYVNYTSSDGTLQFPACVIADATACCQQGIEFVLTDDKYPEEGTQITVVGTFASYVDATDGQTYYHLKDAKIV